MTAMRTLKVDGFYEMGEIDGRGNNNANWKEWYRVHKNQQVIKQPETMIVQNNNNSTRMTSVQIIDQNEVLTVVWFI